MASSCFANFTYALDLPKYKQERPYVVLSYLKEGQQKSNLAWEIAPTEKVQSVRGSENQFTLDDHGFSFVLAPSEFDHWQDTDRTQVEEQYLPEIEQVLRKHIPGTYHVEIFDWHVSY